MNQYEQRDLNREFIFFDIGATLIDGAAQSPAKHFKKLWGLSETDTALINDMLMTRDFHDENSLWAALKEELPFLSSTQKKDVFSVWNEQEKCAVEIFGATELIACLKKRGAHIGMISNIWHPFLASFKRCCEELLGCVDEFFLSYELGVRKPDPEIFKIALRSTRRLDRRAWMVGDTYYLDVMPALELGYKTIWLLRRPEKEKNALLAILNGKAPMPDFTVERLPDVETVLSAAVLRMQER